MVYFSVCARNFKNGVPGGPGMQLCNNIEREKNHFPGKIVVYVRTIFAVTQSLVYFLGAIETHQPEHLRKLKEIDRIPFGQI